MDNHKNKNRVTKNNRPTPMHSFIRTSGLGPGKTKGVSLAPISPSSAAVANNILPLFKSVNRFQRIKDIEYLDHEFLVRFDPAITTIEQLKQRQLEINEKHLIAHADRIRSRTGRNVTPDFESHNWNTGEYNSEVIRHEIYGLNNRYEIKDPLWQKLIRLDMVGYTSEENSYIFRVKSGKIHHGRDTCSGNVSTKGLNEFKHQTKSIFKHVLQAYYNKLPGLHCYNGESEVNGDFSHVSKVMVDLEASFSNDSQLHEYISKEPVFYFSPNTVSPKKVIRINFLKANIYSGLLFTKTITGDFVADLFFINNEYREVHLKMHFTENDLGPGKSYDYGFYL
ncbi:hypothetical protein H4219_002465 [Mycoemilia scoparia]|uniref:Uncharacterized protein n=1 Tax=Mycoemilia scoparia TaxID=417184 RepID=A0A9W7ZXD0_9FUNG|nr:hypothetical protein H4219_002465 [Mycoemilia scoparia]